MDWYTDDDDTVCYAWPLYNQYRLYNSFSKADIKATIYMEIPLGHEVPGRDYVYKSLKNKFGLKSAAKIWRTLYPYRTRCFTRMKTAWIGSNIGTIG